MKQYTHAHFILRCIEIARNGGQKVSPNPMVGSLLVENNEKYSVYGKTGSAKDTNSWFTGFFEKDAKRTYFAVIVYMNLKKPFFVVIVYMNL